MTEPRSIMDSFRLDGKVALVTGGGRGIGRGIAHGLAQAGADVVVTARRAEEIEAVANEVRVLGRRALAVPGDITDGEFVERLADTAVAEMGTLDVWVSNAGGAEDRVPRPITEMPDSKWDYQLNLNLRAVFTGARAAARVMNDGTTIINISSVAAVKPSPNNGPYGAAKAGVNHLTMTLSAELAPRQIRVNAVAPGPIPTEVFMDFFNATEQDLPGLAEELKVPLGRLGTPHDIAAAVVYLASPAASWMTGQILTLDGGHRR